MFIKRGHLKSKVFSRSLSNNIIWHQTHSIYLFFYNSSCWSNSFTTTHCDFTSRKKFFDSHNIVSMQNQFFHSQN